jgi:hypothetical protein
MNSIRFCTIFALMLPAVFVAGCGRKTTAAAAGPVHRHEHQAPHGGTPVVLGAEAYHLELVIDRTAGKLSAFVMDGEMDKYIRLAAPSFAVVATVDGTTRPLLFNAVADSATGEKVGDTALFEATAEWLKTATSFDATLTALEIRGTNFSSVPFNFPKGNDKE